jgi:hypothetical protein
VQWGKSGGKGNEDDSERGEIVVQQSFQMQEEWEMKGKELPPVPDRAKEGSGRIYGRTRMMTDGGSEEELVVGKRMSSTDRGR